MYKCFKNNPIDSSPPICVLRVEDNAFIPIDPDNTDYQEYLKWLSEGNQPYPSDYVEPSNELSVEPLPAEGTA